MTNRGVKKYYNISQTNEYSNYSITALYVYGSSLFISYGILTVI